MSTMESRLDEFLGEQSFLTLDQPKNALQSLQHMLAMEGHTFITSFGDPKDEKTLLLTTTFECLLYKGVLLRKMTEEHNPVKVLIGLLNLFEWDQDFMNKEVKDNTNWTGDFRFAGALLHSYLAERIHKNIVKNPAHSADLLLVMGFLNIAILNQMNDKVKRIRIDRDFFSGQTVALIEKLGVMTEKYNGASARADELQDRVIHLEGDATRAHDILDVVSRQVENAKTLTNI